MMKLRNYCKRFLIVFINFYNNNFKIFIFIFFFIGFLFYIYKIYILEIIQIKNVIFQLLIFNVIKLHFLIVIQTKQSLNDFYLKHPLFDLHLYLN